MPFTAPAPSDAPVALPPPPLTLPPASTDRASAERGAPEEPGGPARALLNPTREEWFHLPALDMWGTDKELPYVNRDDEPVGTWIGLGAFVGDVLLPGKSSEPVTGAWEGAVALTVVGTRLLGIVAPDDLNVPAVWVAVEKGDVEIEASGAQGLFKQRPSLITIGTEHWDLHVRGVAKLTRPCWPPTLHSSNSAQPWKEASLLAALQ